MTPMIPARQRRALVVMAAGAIITLLIFGTPALSQEETPSPGGEPTNETLQQGAEVFRTVCAVCHGPTGAGTPELFPPLRDNQRVFDPVYVEQVVSEGLSGPIEVNGITYDRVMPPPAGLSDVEISAVAAFVAAGLELPEGTETTTPSSAGTVALSLPVASVVSFGLAFLIAAAVAAAVLVPKVVAVTDRVTLPWFDAWLKTSVIVVYFVVGMVLLPSLILELDFIASLPRLAQDLIGVGVWGLAVGIGLWGLWWLQRRNRI